MQLSPAETISDGRTSSRRRRWVSVAIAVAACVVALAAWGEERWVSASRDSLAAAGSDAVTAQSNGEAQILGMISYAGSSLSSPSIEASTRADLRALVRNTALTQAAVVRALTPTRPIPAFWRAELNAQWQQTVSEIEGRAGELTEVAAYYR